MEIDFDALKSFFSIMNPQCLLVLAILMIQLTYCAADPFTTFIKYEQKQRLAAQLGDGDYHLVPFRLTSQPQHFILSPSTDQELSVEVVVHWIVNGSTLAFPLFDLKQKIRVTIEDETLTSAPAKPILNKQFLTQTGFKVKTQAGRRYRWKIESSGSQVKLVEIAMMAKRQTLPIVSAPYRNRSSQLELLEDVRRNLEQAKYRWTLKETQKGEKVSDMWAWMSGLQIASLIVFLGVQLVLFEKFMLPSSIV